MEIEIVTFVVKGSAKLTVSTDWQEQIQVGSRSVALRRVFDLKLILKKFLGEDLQTLLSIRIVLNCIITLIQQFIYKVRNTYMLSPPNPHHFSSKLKIKWLSLYVLFEKSIVFPFFRE